MDYLNLRIFWILYFLRLSGRNRRKEKGWKKIKQYINAIIAVQSTKAIFALTVAQNGLNCRSVPNAVRTIMGSRVSALIADMPSMAMLRLLHHIELQTGVDANEHIELYGDKILYDGDEYKYVFYTCGIDELFKFCYGRLPYRSMIFEEKKIENCKQALPCEICSYPQTEKFIRQTEYKYFAHMASDSADSIVVSEYPVQYDP